MVLVQTGYIICPGFCIAFVPPPPMNPHHRRLRPSMAPNWSFQANLWLPPVSTFVGCLHHLVDSRTPSPTHHNTASQSAPLPPDLLHARMVFVRPDEAKPPLAPAYTGPYLVPPCSPTTFKLQVGPRTNVVAASCLKAALLLPDAPPPQPPLAAVVAPRLRSVLHLPLLRGVSDLLSPWLQSHHRRPAFLDAPLGGGGLLIVSVSLLLAARLGGGVVKPPPNIVFTQYLYLFIIYFVC
jgi:hypothetical protein